MAAQTFMTDRCEESFLFLWYSVPIQPAIDLSIDPTTTSSQSHSRPPLFQYWARADQPISETAVCFFFFFRRPLNQGAS